ncbi:oxygen-independent coproporphyrinogen III oxidase [Sulfitobacter sp. LCG007]
MQSLHQPDRRRLFAVKVPRYTSYPPANHFSATAGAAHQEAWLRAIPEGEAISVYVHIPFCRRLCWFCACRTQGTASLRPVEAYVKDVIAEIGLLRSSLGGRRAIARLHLGGGTPTLLDAATITLLLQALFAAFEPAEGFEFSVEIDPTEAADEVLDALAAFDMNRASIGVQDFDPAVQRAIGREQSFGQTRRAVSVLRAAGVGSLNVDLLYGLPHQDRASLARSLIKVLHLQPDRIALYGYAHVPWMSKRQAMIDRDLLPDAQERYELAALARVHLVRDGYEEIGIDHFSRPGDGLAVARDAGRLRRNFQGYTDDPARTLIGIGASAISQFRQGYCQNAAATSAYSRRIREGRLAGQRGFELSAADRLSARLIEELMCRFSFDMARMSDEFPGAQAEIRLAGERLLEAWPDLCELSDGKLALRPEGHALVRVIAATLDAFTTPDQAHSMAV